MTRELRKASGKLKRIGLALFLRAPIKLNIVPAIGREHHSRRMGNSSISVTADRYGHLYQGNNQDADSLDCLLKRA